MLENREGNAMNGLEPANALSIPESRERINAFDFRAFHPNVRFGTASDRYAGWIGQIYPEHFRAQVRSRAKRLDGQVFEEKMLPVESVAAYFEHFSVLELDFTFYRPLLEPDRKPSPSFFTLMHYAEHAPAEALFFLKAPQTIFARKLRRASKGKITYEDNPDFLNAEAYSTLFHEPARELLGSRLKGIIFEQEYQRVSEGPDPEENIAEMDAFFRNVPGGLQAHLELRSLHLLIPPYFDWLQDRGIGFVFSHWTWLPQIRQQWRLSGERFTAANGDAIARLLTPINMPYARAYAASYPFDKTNPDIAESAQAREMVLDATALSFQAERQGALLNVIANNRAWGNAPALAQAVAHRILDEKEKRG